MSSYCQQEPCPNCRKLINVSYDTRDGIYSACHYCGLRKRTRVIVDQVSLEELNDLREEYNSDIVVEEGDSKLEILSELPEWNL